MRRHARGQVSQQVGYIIVAVVIVLAFAAHYVKKGLNLGSAYGVDPQLQKQIIQWRREAELVIIGRIIGVREQINEGAQQAFTDPAMSYVVLDVQVEDVLRGSAPGDIIQVYFGWVSADDEAEEFPVGVKQSYQNGERVKLFLNYDEKRFGYYSPGAFYTMDPAE